MTHLRVVGVDPGPIPGVVALSAGPGPLRASVFQCDAGSVLWLVRRALLVHPDEGSSGLTGFAAGGWIRPQEHHSHRDPCDHVPACLTVADVARWYDVPLSVLGHVPAPPRIVLAVERFVVGPRSSRLSTPQAAASTRDMVGKVLALGAELSGVTVVQRSAAEVMPWASDKRLSAIGLLSVTKGMPHARAASRHALFAAVRDGGMPDPLSTRARKAGA